MSMEPTRPLDPRMVRVWRIHEVIALAVELVIAVPLCLFVPEFWVVLACAVVLAVQLVCLVVVPRISYRRWRYEVTNTDVLVRSGLIVVTTSVIPMVRVQHVETTQGPILKANGLASVTITTAGSKFEIPGLASAEAETLRDQVAVLEDGVVSDVLPVRGEALGRIRRAIGIDGRARPL